MKFGDNIDWNAEARRAAREGMPGPSPAELLQRLAACLGGAKAKVVDCGCNIARFHSSVVAYPNLSYIGVDQAEEAIAIARKLYPGIQIEHAMLWDDWPARTGTVDAAFCNAVLQHNTHPEKRRILARIAEAVRVGGFFAMQESTVVVETGTQLQQGAWVTLVESFGFRLLTLWHPNQEFGILDGYVFERVK